MLEAVFAARPSLRPQATFNALPDVQGQASRKMTDNETDGGESLPSPRQSKLRVRHPAAIDLRNGRGESFLQKPVAVLKQDFLRLRVLALSGNPLSSNGIADLLQHVPMLESLDISECGLTALPGPNSWNLKRHLTMIFVHKNYLSNAKELSGPCSSPALLWITAFENPVSHRVGYRRYLIEKSPGLLAIDFAPVSDDERPGLERHTDGEPTRFSNLVLPTVVASYVAGDSARHVSNVWGDRREGDSTAGVDLTEELTEEAMLEGLRQVLAELRRRRRDWSAIVFIQTHWKALKARRGIAGRKAVMKRSCELMQACVRRFLWRKKMIAYTKEYLAEIEELDLIADDQEMLVHKATRVIEAGIRTWVRKRQREARARKACERIQRSFRGFLTRRRLIWRLFQTRSDRTVFFPERVSWGVRLLLNVVHRLLHLPPLPPSHAFATASLVAVRIGEPEMADPRRSTVVEMAEQERRWIVRPLHQHRFPEYPWDGPFHQLPEVGWESHRLARCSRADQRHFREACVEGDHPVICDSAADTPAGQDIGNEALLMLIQDENTWSSFPLPIQQLLKEAKEEDPDIAWPKRRRGTGSRRHSEGGRKDYRGSRWLNQRLLVHSFTDPRVSDHFYCLVKAYNRAAQHLRLFLFIPLIAGFPARRLAAVVVIQSCWRSYRERARDTIQLPIYLGESGLAASLSPESLAHARSLPLRRALTLRRSCVAIQRCWKWSLLKRRIAMLSRAAEFIEGIRHSTLHIEERLFLALNLIGSLDRFTPMLRERLLGIGAIFAQAPGPSSSPSALLDDTSSVASFSSASQAANMAELVLVTPELMRAPGKGRNSSKGVRVDPLHMHEHFVDQKGTRRGLPKWLMAHLGREVKLVGPDDSSLVGTTGLRGIMLHGATSNLSHHNEDLREVKNSNLEHMAKKRIRVGNRLDNEVFGDEELSVPSAALVASTGRFRVVDLRYGSVAQAKLHALALFFCTFSLRAQSSVPLLTGSSTITFELGRRILRLWHTYGLAWNTGDRTAIQRARYMDAYQVQVQPFCGTLPISQLEKPDHWMQDDALAAATEQKVPGTHSPHPHGAKEKASEEGTGKPEGPPATTTISELLSWHQEAVKAQEEEQKAKEAAAGGFQPQARAGGMASTSTKTLNANMATAATNRSSVSFARAVSTRSLGQASIGRAGAGGGNNNNSNNNNTNSNSHNNNNNSSSSSNAMLSLASAMQPSGSGSNLHSNSNSNSKSKSSSKSPVHTTNSLGPGATSSSWHSIQLSLGTASLSPRAAQDVSEKKEAEEVEARGHRLKKALDIYDAFLVNLSQRQVQELREQEEELYQQQHAVEDKFRSAIHKDPTEELSKHRHEFVIRMADNDGEDPNPTLGYQSEDSDDIGPVPSVLIGRQPHDSAATGLGANEGQGQAGAVASSGSPYSNNNNNNNNSNLHESNSNIINVGSVGLQKSHSASLLRLPMSDFTEAHLHPSDLQPHHHHQEQPMHLVSSSPRASPSPSASMRRTVVAPLLPPDESDHRQRHQHHTSPSAASSRAPSNAPPLHRTGSNASTQLYQHSHSPTPPPAPPKVLDSIDIISKYCANFLEAARAEGADKTSLKGKEDAPGKERDIKMESILEEAANRRKKRKEEAQARSAAAQSHQRLASQLEKRKQKAQQELEYSVAEKSFQDLQQALDVGTGHAAGAVGAFEVVGCIPPTTGDRIDTEKIVSGSRAERTEVRDYIATGKEEIEANLLENKLKVQEWKSTNHRAGGEFEERLYHFYGEVEEEKRQITIDRKKQRNEVALAYKQQAYDRIRGGPTKGTDLERHEATNTRDIDGDYSRDARAEGLEGHKQALKEHVKGKYEERKAKLSARKEQKALLLQLTSNTAKLQRSAEAASVAAARSEVMRQQEGAISERSEGWGLRQKACQDRNTVIKEHRQKEVADLKSSLIESAQTRAALEEHELQAVRHRIGDEKMLERLVRSARDRLNLSSEELAQLPPLRAASLGASLQQRQVESAIGSTINFAQRVGSAVKKQKDGGAPKAEKEASSFQPLPPKPTPRWLPKPPASARNARSVPPRGDSEQGGAGPPNSAREALRPLIPKGNSSASDGGSATPRSARGARGNDETEHFGPAPGARRLEEATPMVTAVYRPSAVVLDGSLQALSDAWCRKLGASHLASR